MRLPLIAPADMNPEQRSLYDDMREGIQRYFQGFKVLADNGALMGPWNPWLQQPKYGKPIWELALALAIAPSLPRNARQVAIVVAGGKFHAAYELYAHVLVSEARGLSDDKLSTLTAGHRPPDLTPEEAIAYDVASALLDHGTLPEINYRQAVKRFGVHGAGELIYLVGFYCMVSVILNGFNVPVPDSEAS
jgi:alkylhydroperoxidase family enzyme